VALDPPEVDELILDTTVEIQLVRIIQEALANVRKHARASQVQVKVRVQDPCLLIAIKDNGRGFSTLPTEGPRRRFGLTIMRERAESVGGKCRVISAPAQGTTVEVEVPLRGGGLLHCGARQDIAGG